MALQKIERKAGASRTALRNYRLTRKAKFGLESPTRCPSPGREYLRETDDRRRQSANGDSIATLTYDLGELPHEDVIGDSGRAVRAICTSGHWLVVRPCRSDVSPLPWWPLAVGVNPRLQNPTRRPVRVTNT